jgi:hypothetical protein
LLAFANRESDVGTAGGPNVGALAFLNALVFFNMIVSGIILLASVVCDPSPVFVPVLMREMGNSPRGVSEGGA